MPHTPRLDRRRFVGALGAAIVLPAIAGAQEGEPQELPVHPEPLRVVTDTGERLFEVEVADEDRERAIGLMFRRDMADDRGMLFVFQSTRRLGFWMKNTPMPLDLIFIGEDGRVRAVLPGEPFSTAPISPPEPVRFVLELKAGIAQKTGIAVGDRMHHPEIDRVAGRG